MEEAEGYNAVESDPDTLELDCVFHFFLCFVFCGLVVLGFRQVLELARS